MGGESDSTGAVAGPMRDSMEAGGVTVMALTKKVYSELVVDGDLFVEGIIGEFRVVLDASKEAVESEGSDTEVAAKEIGTLVTDDV